MAPSPDPTAAAWPYLWPIDVERTRELLRR